jgi:diguanylate cyclase
MSPPPFELWSSLRLRIVGASVLMLVLGIAATGLALVHRAEVDTLHALSQQEVAEAARAAELVEQRVRAYRRMLVAAATQAATSIDNADAATAFLRSKPVLLDQFDAVTLVDAQGALLAHHDSAVLVAGSARSPSLADRPYFQQCVADARPVLTRIAVDDPAGPGTVAIAVPVLASASASGTNSTTATPSTAAVRGVLVGALRLHSREGIGAVAGHTGADLQHSASTLVTDSAGTVLVHQRPEMIGGHIRSDPQFSAAFERWGKDGSLISTGGQLIAAPQQLVSMAAVASADWLVWRARPTAQALAPMAAARTQAWRWAGAVVAVATVLLSALLWWLLRPLVQLRQRAATMFDVQHGEPVPWPQGHDEIGALSQIIQRVVAERMQLESHRASTMQRLQSVMQAAPIGIAFTRERRFEVVSPHLWQLLGYEEAALVGQPAQVIYASGEDYARIGPQVGAAFAAHRQYQGEWELLHRDGHRFWGRLRAQPVDWQDASAGTIWAIQDISEEVRTRELLEWSATHDSLTGLANRKRLEQRAAKVLEALPESQPAALLLMDLDRFKPINDQHGHAAGDAMLKAVAGAIQSCVRGGDLVARLGGDEFTVLLERCPGEVALRVAQDITQAVSQLQLSWAGEQLAVGISVGLSPLTSHVSSVAAWTAAADAACYRAKSAGRGRVAVAAV